MKKAVLSIILALALLLLPAVPFSAAAQAKSLPATKEEILSLYRNAVEDVRSGSAGFVRTDWQKLGDLKITGNSAVDEACRNVIVSYLTSEENAEPLVTPRATPEAADRLPACTLTDLSAVESASFEEAGDLYVMEIVFCEEDSPRSRECSRLAQVTDNIAYKDDLDAEISQISVFSGKPEYRVKYQLTVTCLLTRDGRIMELLHETETHVDIVRAKAMFVTVKDAWADMTSYSHYTRFDYGAVPYRPGDVDGDTQVTPADARLALRAAVKLQPLESTSLAFVAADMDASGEIEPADARTILRISVGLAA